MMLIDNESWINEHVLSESSGSTKFDPSHYQANKMFNKLLVLLFLLQTYKHTHKYTMITTTTKTPFWDKFRQKVICIRMHKLFME